MVNRSGSAANIGQGDTSTAESIKGTNKSVWFDRKLHEERGQNDPCQSVMFLAGWNCGILVKQPEISEEIS